MADEPPYTPQQVQQAVFEELKGNSPGYLRAFGQRVARRLGIPEEERRWSHLAARAAIDELWVYACRGLVRPANIEFEHQDSGTGGWFERTRASERFFSDPEVEPLPASASQYQDRLARKAPGLDQVAIEYAVEGFQACVFKCYRSATVMLGGASERLFVGLFAALLAWPAAGSQHPNLQKAYSQRNIKQQHDAMVKALEALATAVPIPDNLVETLPIWLEYFFSALRLSRNEAGHPSGIKPDPDEISVMIQLFPSYAARLLAMQEYIQTHS